MKFIFQILFILVSFSNIASNLPIIFIKTSEPITFDNKINCLISAEFDGNISEHHATIKCRGGFSSKFNKHSYKIEFDKKSEFCGLPKEDDWILNANYIDKTFMRHKLSYDLFRQMGENNFAPQSKFVLVFLNDEYRGIYVLMQFISAKFCGINKKDESAFLFKDPPLFYNPNTFVPFVSENPYGQKFPKYKKRDISDKLINLQKFLFETDDLTFSKNVSKIFDLENIADWHILLLLTNNQDGVLKNFYLYKQDEFSPVRFAIWDYDHSFGRDGDNELNMLERKVECEKAVLIKRLIENQSIQYKKLLVKQWKKHRANKTISFFNISKMIFENHIKIQTELKRNFILWPVNSENYFDDSNYYTEIVLMLDFLKIRIPELDKYFLEMEKNL